MNFRKLGERFSVEVEIVSKHRDGTPSETCKLNHTEHNANAEPNQL